MSGKSILIIEDEKPLADAVKAKLESQSFNVLTARTVEQALSYLGEMPVDGIWLDHYLLGKENGLDFIAKIKQSGSEWENLPVFVVSNTASEKNIQSYMRLGAKKYYVKAEHSLTEIINEIIDYLTNGEKE